MGRLLARRVGRRDSLGGKERGMVYFLDAVDWEWVVPDVFRIRMPRQFSLPRHSVKYRRH